MSSGIQWNAGNFSIQSFESRGERIWPSESGRPKSMKIITSLGTQCAIEDFSCRFKNH